MNRIAIKIKEARQKAKLTEKQLAKKCGLTEGYIIQIESGRKVINEKAAESIFNALGTKFEFVEKTEELEVKETKPKEEKPVVKKEEFYNIQPTDQWSDALANIIKKFPIYEIETNKTIGFKELPVLGKKIYGYHWDKLMFIQAPNNDLEAFRIKRNDIIMLCQTNEIHNNSLYLLEMNQKKIIRQLRREANNTVILATDAKGENSITTEINKIKVIGKCIKVEFQLDK